MENIKVSVIVAIYNSAPFLNKLLDSIINQTYSNIEIILVDDGSLDNSGIICDEYKKKDDRILVIHKENGGACEARNTGLELSSGDYVVIVDGDDWLELDFVEYLVNIIVMTNSDMAMTDHIFTTRDRTQTVDDEIEVWSAEKATIAILYPYIDIGPWNKMYKRKILFDNNITFSVPWSGEGLYFASTAAQHSNQVAVGHKKIYNYRLNNENSGLTKYNVQMGLNAYYNIRNIENNLYLKTKGIKDAIEQHKWSNYFFVLLLITATDSKKEYIDKYWECRRNIILKLPYCIIHSKISLRKKIGMIKLAFFPILSAKQTIVETNDKLKQDIEQSK